MTGQASLQDSPVERSAVPTSRWPCWVEVDLDALGHNVRAMQRIAEPRRGVIAVLKAQAYGLGATAIAEAALEAGAIGLAVARVSEGALLRGRRIVAPILVLGGTAPDEAESVVRLGLTPTITDWPTAERFAAAAAGAGTVLGVHVKVDTGMTRYGAPPDDAVALVRRLRTLPTLRLDGFFTHFAAADDPDPFFAHQQIARYRAIVDRLRHEGIDPGLQHVANSAGALRVPDSGLDAIRVGIALTGGYATGWVQRTPELHPVAAFRSRVVRLHNPAIGTSIGYGRTYKVHRPMRTALVACGYADGLPRATSNRGSVLIRGERAPLVGTVSMDMAMADVTHIAGVEPGDEVTLIGRQGTNEITLDEFADSAGIIPHEALVRLGARVPRVYLRKGRPVQSATLSCDERVEVAGH